MLNLAKIGAPPAPMPMSLLRILIWFQMPARVFRVIVDMVAPDMEPDPAAIIEPVALEKRVAIALWVLGRIPSH